MITLDTILDNISEYSDDIDNLVAQLRELGIKDLDEFKNKAREFGVAIPKRIQDEVNARFQNSDKDDWETARAVNTIDAYQKYMDEHPDGEYRDAARNAKNQLSQAEREEATAGIWEGVNKKRIDDLKSFIDNYPDDPHIAEANRLLRDLRREDYLGVDIKALAKQMKDIEANKMINNPQNVIFLKIEEYIKEGKISVDSLIDAISADHNFISSRVAYMLWDKGILTDADYAAAGIDRDFITYMLANRTPETFQPADPLNRVTKIPCTEVYFWGIPSSGKSCALGGVLSAAGCGKYALSMAKDNNCQGYGYMNRLANLFKSDGQVGALPEGTPVTSTYEMGFNLVDENDRVHPITCIDLAGELVRCMFKNDAKEQMTNEENAVLATLTNVLRDNKTNNRKIHFFVIEYGAEDRLYENLPQNTYLEAAVRYIERTGIFAEDTDGLYLLISKVDKAKAKGAELQEKLRSYIQSNYLGFYNGLKKICKDHEINGGQVSIMPFTLGDVCFQNYCKFKDATASKVVLEIMARSYGYKSNKLNKFLNKLTK